LDHNSLENQPAKFWLSPTAKKSKGDPSVWT
jgi:hypothetical protein